MKYVGVGNQPLSRLRWVPRDTLVANDYNPNHVAPLERKLLKISLLECGWTQPIVVLADGRTIVDGFHRWTLSGDAEVAAMTEGLVPVVTVELDEGQRRAATIRHNRARGTHGIKPMGEIVAELASWGWTHEQIMHHLGMQREEVVRLLDNRGNPERIGREHGAFGGAWKPEHGQPAPAAAAP